MISRNFIFKILNGEISLL